MRHFTVRPWMAGLGVCCLLVFATGYLLGTAYLFMRDDLIDSSMARQAHLEHLYESRIATLRGEIDEAASKQRSERRKMETRIRKLSEMQTALASRRGLAGPLFDRARLAGLLDNDIPTPRPRPDRMTDTAPAIDAIDSVTHRTHPGERIAGAHVNAYADDPQLRPVALATAEPQTDSTPADPDRMAGRLAISLRKMESEQLHKVQRLTQRAVKAAGAIRTVLDKSGVSLGSEPHETVSADDGSADAATSEPAPGLGGPFIRMSNPTHFGKSLAELNTALDRLERVRKKARKLPFGRPLPVDVVTSPFGARSDPFLDKAAFHPGVDLRAAYGTDVHATGAGTVTFAGRNGGYGNMVEIDHGDGITTRYGHLSHIGVSKGEHVAYGALIGESGSTGRSTGPHLHYEVRLDGHPVNPTRFLDTGLTLQALLNG